MPSGACQGLDPLMPWRTIMLPAHFHLKPGRHSHSPPHLCLGGRTVSPSSGGVGHSLILPGLLQTQGAARVLLGREAPASRAVECSGLPGAASPLPRGPRQVAAESQGQPAPLTSRRHLPSVLPFAWETRGKLWDSLPWAVKTARRDKARPLPPTGPLPHSRFRVSIFSPPHPPTQARAAHE